MSDDSIAKGLKARAQQRAAQGRGGGGASSGPGPQTYGTNFGQGGVASQYNEWSFGISYGTGLDRPWADFLSGAFGPLSPIQPLGIDAPQTESGRPEPRRMQYPIGWNMPMGQPGSEGLKLVSFANLRAYADMYSVVRACIQVRKEEIMGLDWDIVPTDTGARGMRGDADAHDDFQDRRAQALKFFKRPDPNYHDFQGWLSAVLEDVFVVDALSLYLHPPRVAGKGLLGSNLSAIEILDGTTIRPLLDIRGGTPRPPSVAYQQYLWGVPRTDLMDIILEADIDEMGEPVDEYRADQLLYLPYTRRSWTPYGFPGIERAIIPVMTGLRRQQYQLDFFSEGTIPGQFVVPGDDISTPQQIRQLQDTLNALAGDQAYKHKIIVLPRGSSTQNQKPVELAGQIDETLTQMICMAYDVMPMELGISSGSSQSQSSGAASQMAKASAEINQRKALKPMLSWLKGAIFDHILQDICGQDDMQFQWIGLEDSVDEQTMADNFKTMISTGVLSIDEARTQMGLNPWGLPLTSDPVFATATGLTTLGVISPSVADAELGVTVAGAAGEEGPTQIAIAETINSNGSSSGPTPTTEGDAKPSSSVGTPGIGGRPKTDGTPAGQGGGAPSITQPAAGTSTPLHGNKKKKQLKATEKAAQVELESLRRFLKKGKSLDNFSPEFISEKTFAVIKKSLSQGDDAPIAIKKGKASAKMQAHVERRDAAIENVSDSVASALHSLSTQIDDPQVGMIGFIDRGTRVLQQGYHAIYNAASRNAAAHYPNVSRVIPRGFASLAAQRAEAQRGFLTGFARDLKGDVSQAKINQRVALYSRTLQPAYEQGHGLAVLSGMALGNSTIPADNTYVDVAGDDSSAEVIDNTDITTDNTDVLIDDSEITTDNSEIADDSEITDDSEVTNDFSDTEDGLYSSDQIPDDAGYDDFSELNDEYDTTDAFDASDDEMGGLLAFAGLIGLGLLGDIISELPTDASDGGDFQIPPFVNIIWHNNGDDPCELCAERDGEEYTADTLPCWPGDGGFGEFCDGAANCRCSLEYTEGDESLFADNPFNDFSVPFYQQRAAEENAYDQAAIDARAEEIAAVREESPGAAARMEARDALYGVPNTRDSYFAGAEPDIAKKENESLKDAAWYYLKSHYKKRAIQWAKEATWTFNPKINVDDLILMRHSGDIDKNKVADIKEEFEEGRTVHPIVVVKTDQGYEVADGNHRITALKQLGIETVAAYVASGVGNAGTWTTMMQDNTLKKFEKYVHNDNTETIMYKAMSAETFLTLKIGDIVTDDSVMLFSSTRPTSVNIAIIKNVPTGRLLPGQELIVTDISGNEVTLEIN